MPAVEGLTPEILWYTLVGIVGIGALIVLGDKVIEVFRKRAERKQLERQPEDNLADVISKKVIEKLEPRFEEIERKLVNDKNRLDNHSMVLAKHTEQIEQIEKGNRALCRGILCLLEQAGEGEDAVKARKDIMDYLIEK